MRGTSSGCGPLTIAAMGSSPPSLVDFSIEGHVVAAQGRDPGRLHAAGTAADDEHLLLRRRPSRWSVNGSAEQRVDAAALVPRQLSQPVQGAMSSMPARRGSCSRSRDRRGDAWSCR